MNRPSRRATVVLVDDDADDRALIEEALGKSCPSAEVRHACDGEELLDYLEQLGDRSKPTSPPLPDLILLDLNMPRMNGRETLRAVKSDLATRRVPVVVFSTSTAQDDVEAAYALGANSFVSKPSSYAALTADIATLSDYWLKLAELPSRHGGLRGAR